MQSIHLMNSIIFELFDYRVEMHGLVSLGPKGFSSMFSAAARIITKSLCGASLCHHWPSRKLPW